MGAWTYDLPRGRHLVLSDWTDRTIAYTSCAVARDPGSRPFGAAPRRLNHPRHAGDVRSQRQGHRQSDNRDLRRIRLVRNAAARRFQRSDARAAAGAGGARRRGRHIRVYRNARLSSDLARGRGDGARGLRCALRRGGQLRARGGQHIAAAGVHPSRLTRGTDLGAPGSAGLLAVALLWPSRQHEREGVPPRADSHARTPV